MSGWASTYQDQLRRTAASSAGAKSLQLPARPAQMVIAAARPVIPCVVREGARTLDVVMDSTGELDAQIDWVRVLGQVVQTR